MGTQIALYHASEPLTDLIQKLSGNDGDEWLRTLKKFLRKETCFRKPPVIEFPVWRTIRLGVLKTVDQYRMALRRPSIKVSAWADDILNRISCAEQEVDVDLVIASVAELGFEERDDYKDICARALQHGLELCPAEVGPALRISYDQQTWGEPFAVAMESIVDSGECPTIFTMECGDTTPFFLGGCEARGGSIFNPAFRFIFVRPRR